MHSGEKRLKAKINMQKNIYNCQSIIVHKITTLQEETSCLGDRITAEK